MSAIGAEHADSVRPLLSGGLICLPCPSVCLTSIHLLTSCATSIRPACFVKKSSFWLYFGIDPDPRVPLRPVPHFVSL